LTRARVDDPRRQVSKLDVLTALNILGLERNVFGFFVDAPRRLHLDCFVFRRRMNIEKQLAHGPVSLTEAESALSIVQDSFVKRRHDSFSGSGENAESSQESGSSTDVETKPQERKRSTEGDSDSSERDSQSDSQENSLDSDLSDGERLRELYATTFDQAQSMTSSDHRTKQMNLIDAEIEDERAEERALEEYDVQSKAQEESELWARLGQDYERAAVGVIRKDIGHAPSATARSKTEHALKSENILRSGLSSDWRDWTEYHAPWEIQAFISPSE
jgi:hypothetical protein